MVMARAAEVRPVSDVSCRLGPCIASIRETVLAVRYDAFALWRVCGRACAQLAAVCSGVSARGGCARATSCPALLGALVPGTRGL